MILLGSDRENYFWRAGQNGQNVQQGYSQIFFRVNDWQISEVILRVLNPAGQNVQHDLNSLRPLLLGIPTVWEICILNLSTCTLSKTNYHDTFHENLAY